MWNGSPLTAEETRRNVGIECVKNLPATEGGFRFHLNYLKGPWIVLPRLMRKRCRSKKERFNWFTVQTTVRNVTILRHRLRGSYLPYLR